MLQIGQFRVHILNDGDTRVDPGGAFGLVPRKLWSRYMEPDEDHLVPMIGMCVLVQADTYNVLIDTGLGTKLDERALTFWKLARPRGDVISALGRLGLNASDITHVINTHLHADHCSGNTCYDDNGHIVPTFPNARHYVQRREYEDAENPNERTRATYLRENWAVLVENGQMQFMDGDADILPGIRGVVTRGHTPGHMSVRIESEGQHAAYLCDLATYAVHFERLGWMTAYDVEPLHTLETKRIWQRWALETNAVLIFGHDPLRPLGRLTHEEGRRPTVIPIDEPFA